MDDLWDAIAELGSELHVDRAKAAADKLATIGAVENFAQARQSFGPNVDEKLVSNLRYAWRQNPHITPQEVAAALRAATKTSWLLDRRETVELVWTGPSTGLISSRHTEQALLEVIDSAKRQLILVSFVAFDVPSITVALKSAVARGVQVMALFEPPKSRGGKVDVDSIAVFSTTLPEVKIYTWCKDTKVSKCRDGAVHAKCAVADGRIAFITSANLTMAALERNMELGVLIRGGIVPRQLENHFKLMEGADIIKHIGRLT